MFTLKLELFTKGIMRNEVLVYRRDVDSDYLSTDNSRLPHPQSNKNLVVILF